MSKKSYARLTVPPNIWMGFQGMSKSQSLLLNVADIEHDPKEGLKKEIEEISYNWR